MYNQGHRLVCGLDCMLQICTQKVCICRTVQAFITYAQPTRKHPTKQMIATPYDLRQMGMTPHCICCTRMHVYTRCTHMHICSHICSCQMKEGFKLVDSRPGHDYAMHRYLQSQLVVGSGLSKRRSAYLVCRGTAGWFSKVASRSGAPVLLRPCHALCILLLLVLLVFFSRNAMQLSQHL